MLVPFFPHLVYDKVQDQNHVLNVEFHLVDAVHVHDIHFYLDQFVRLFLNFHVLNVQIVVEEFLIVFLKHQFHHENVHFVLDIVFLI